MEKWMLRNVKANVNKLAQDLGISAIIAKLLINRGIIDKENGIKYIKSSVESLNDPLLMKDMVKGVQIIKENIEKKKKILIVGDYDVDGVISTFILYSSLLTCNADVKFHLPDRIIEGYGMNENIIRNAKNEGIDLIITCDNGISAVEQVTLAKELGMSIVITDHHDIPFIVNNDETRTFVVPKADAVINPKQLDCEYPFKSLCGAGVILKVIQILFDSMGINKNEVDKYFEYASIATVCDVVDLIDENRIIVKKGLELINHTQNIGLKALIDKTGLADKTITCYSLGYVIGPCINASGRLLSAEVALNLLLTNDLEEANRVAQQLYDLNKARKDMTTAGVEQAINKIEKIKLKNDKVLLVYLPEVHESIAGIIAGRLRERYNLPTIILTKSKNGIKGSGRSIEQYNMFEGLIECKDMLVKFGGHPMAAGLSLEEDKIDMFRERLNTYCKLSEDDIIPKVKIDMQLPFEKVSMKLAEELLQMEPFGKGNQKPHFAEKKIKVLKADILGANKNVLKMKCSTRDGIKVDSIYFGDIDVFNSNLVDKYGKTQLIKMYEGKSNDIELDLVFSININEFRGNRSVQLNISNFRVA